jgi:ATP-dependent exoDNAse (exonuclease V) alpha subunit
VKAENPAREFPFMDEVPKRQRVKIVDVWDEIAGAIAYTSEHGALMPVSRAAKALNVGRTRIDQLVSAKKLVRIDVYDRVFVTVKSVREHAEAPRVKGRPKKAEK